MVTKIPILRVNNLSANVRYRVYSSTTVNFDKSRKYSRCLPKKHLGEDTIRNEDILTCVECKSGVKS